MYISYLTFQLIHRRLVLVKDLKVVMGHNDPNMSMTTSQIVDKHKT